jgi:hypothetical protein
VKGNLPWVQIPPPPLYGFEMDALDRLLAKTEITDVVARYARGIDRLDMELVRSCYHPSARDDHGTFKGSVEDFVEWLPDQLARFESTMRMEPTR